jgi:hypothetical protein
MLQNLCEDHLGYVWGGLFSRQPASSRLFGLENESRPEGGCRLIARPTFLKLFSRRLVSLGLARQTAIARAVIIRICPILTFSA